MQEERDREQREHAFRFRADHEAANQQEQHEQHRQQRDHDAEDREQLHRHGREAGHQIEVQPHQLEQRILRLAGAALLVRDANLDRTDREGVGQRRDEGVVLRALVDRVDDVRP